jgi:hypothetical protein
VVVKSIDGASVMQYSPAVGRETETTFLLLNTAGPEGSM